VRFRNLKPVAVLALLGAACADSPDQTLTAPNPPAFSMHTCELGVSSADAYAEIAALRAQIDALEASGTLASGRANALRNHLDNAVRHLDMGINCPVLAQLQAFREQVSSFVAAGVLTETQAAPLLDGVNEVLDGPPPPGPIAVNDAFDATEDQILNVAQPGILGNDIDIQGSGLTPLLVMGPSNGSVTLFPDGSFSYTPNVDFSGTDQLTYRVSDGTAVSDVASVTLTVHPVNDAPVAVDDSYSLFEGVPLIVNAPGVLGNDLDVDGDALTFILVSAPNGAVSWEVPDGSFVYSPGATFSGTDQFTYKANDGTADSNIATVTITAN
jgi:hypothetical protein